MKTVLITGASGCLGHHLVNACIKRGDTMVKAVLGRSEDKMNQLPTSSNLVVYPATAMFNTDFGHIDTLIHTAFSRGDDLRGLTNSIDLMEHIIEMVNSTDVESIINISSQGVYKGKKPGEMVNEAGVIEPNTAYGLAKWAVENMLKVGCKKHYTNIRMASLSANARFLVFFVDCVMAGKGRSGHVTPQYLKLRDPTVLERAYWNTVKLLDDEVVIEREE